MTGEQNEWLALLEAELARRRARVEWQVGADERAKQRLIAELEAMAERYAAYLATASHLPLPIDDLSPAEKLALHLLPESMQPAGLPSEAAIWAEVRGRKAGGL